MRMALLPVLQSCWTCAFEYSREKTPGLTSWHNPSGCPRQNGNHFLEQKKKDDTCNAGIIYTYGPIVSVESWCANIGLVTVP